ncbi:unnamed protein product [Victoria cruziana]
MNLLQHLPPVDHIRQTSFFPSSHHPCFSDIEANLSRLLPLLESFGELPFFRLTNLFQSGTSFPSRRFGYLRGLPVVCDLCLSLWPLR